MAVEQYLSTKQVSERLGIAEGTLENWRVKKWGPGYRKFGKAVRYAESDLERWLSSHPTMKTSFRIISNN